MTAMASKNAVFCKQQPTITGGKPNPIRMIARFSILVLLLAVVPPLDGHGQHSRARNPVPQEDTAVHPIASSEQERADFNAAYAQTGALALEMAANQFAQQYPESNLREYLYAKAMRAYELENNPAGVLAAAQKLLAIKPDHAVALALKATILADQLENTDRDRAQKIEEIRKTANQAVESVGKGFAPAPALSEQDAAVYRTTLQSMAYSALGIMELKTGDDAKAEKDLNTAAVLTKITPDAYIWYHLALAQDHRKKYAAALNSVQQALQLASSNPELQRLAEIEFDRLSGLAGRTPRGADQPQ
jgi:tetratricopeptide (TPR) repeat protein